MRIATHPILGEARCGIGVSIEVDGVSIEAIEGEPIAAALMAAGCMVLRRTPRSGSPRGVFCAVGRCTDCVMTVNGIANVRTCVTPVEAGMRIETGKS